MELEVVVKKLVEVAEVEVPVRIVRPPAKVVDAAVQMLPVARLIPQSLTAAEPL